MTADEEYLSVKVFKGLYEPCSDLEHSYSSRLTRNGQCHTCTSRRRPIQKRCPLKVRLRAYNNQVFIADQKRFSEVIPEFLLLSGWFDQSDLPPECIQTDAHHCRTMACQPKEDYYVNASYTKKVKIDINQLLTGMYARCKQTVSPTPRNTGMISTIYQHGCIKDSNSISDKMNDYILCTLMANIWPERQWNINRNQQSETKTEETAGFAHLIITEEKP